MENKIKILPQSLSNKIAAGEVVNRPESAVKELIENSLDAGATAITLIIREAGKSLIQIIDNGSGMSEEDAFMAFQRHSTSKISVYEDLENILSFGFRGEALASICSVSQVELKTKTAGQELGTLIKVDGNEIVENSKISCETGTSISIKNLFFNTPGRRNFLKSNQTEFKHIYESFIKLAISKPQVAFQFINNDDVLFDLKPSTLIERLENIFTKNLTNELIRVENNHSIIKVNGFISKPNFTKKAKQDQYFYLNNRIINSKNLNYAVYSGYDDLIEKGDYPSFFLFIDIIPSKVDVNVHPSKLEVKFDNEGAVFGFIRNSVKEALRKADLVFEVKFDDSMKFENSNETLSKNTNSNTNSGFKPADNDLTESKFTFAKSTSNSQENFSTRKPGVNIHSIFDATRKFEEKPDAFTEQPLDENTKLHQRKPEEEKFNIWQYQLKYVMCQTETGLMIIDQHAAHERVLYEKALLQLESQSSFSQQLLIPIKVELTKIDYQIAEELRSELQNLGFNFNSLKNDTIELIGLPSDVRLGDERKIFQELLDQYKDYELKLNLEKRDNLAKSFSCRSAIKTGDRLTVPEMTNLVDNLFACTMPYVCPHGRPTVIRITTDELDKRFSRT